MFQDSDTDSDYLRTFDVLQRLRVQDGWSVEIRKRTSGKAAGQTYKVWMTPSGGQLWSKFLDVASSNLFYAVVLISCTLAILIPW